MIRIHNENSESCVVGRGVRLGFLSSPLLFTLYAELVMIDAMDTVKGGIKVGGNW